MKKILLASALLLGVSFTSCNSYLDINTDPNSPAEENIETSMLMPAIEMNTASSYGNFCASPEVSMPSSTRTYSGTSNYLDYSKFNMSATAVAEPIRNSIKKHYRT